KGDAVRLQRTILVVAIMCASSVAAQEQPKGTLCFSQSSECRPTTGMQFEVAPADALRRWVWNSEDHRTLFAGELSAGATTIDLESKETPRRTIALAFRGQVTRGWPADATLTIYESREKEWKWELPAEVAGREVKIHVPVANYVIFGDAPRHLRMARRLPSENPLALGTVELQPIPSLRGRVVRLDEERVVAVNGAQILLGDGKAGGATNEQGEFRIELSDTRLKEIVIAAPGFGSRVVTFERLEAENDFGEIRLETGVTLTLQVERPKELRDKTVVVRLLREEEKRYEHARVATGELAAGDEELRFPDLAPGKYYALFEGFDPLERMLSEIEVGKENLVKEIEIRPFRLQGRVLIGEEPLRKGEVEMMPAAAGETWRARLPIEDDGRFGGVMWQRGVLGGFVHQKENVGGILIDESPELGSDPSVWTMSFKDRLIHGRIFDAESGKAAEGVQFALKTISTDNKRGSSQVSVTPDGEYRIRAWQDGAYDLIVSARDLLPETKTIELSEVDGSRKVDFALEQGLNVKLEFFWSTGVKILLSNIFEGVARDGHNPERIHRQDAGGILTLRVRPGETRALYVLPTEGSFLPVRITAGRSSDDEPQRVEIPAPAGKLRVRLKDRDGNPTQGLVLMRYNGEWIPYPVSARLRNNASPGMIEYTALPAGAYELWAVIPRGREAIANMPPSHPPVRAGVAAGETEVEVTVLALP
ncbi:MAG TPA: carboxypeptidase-like regulatory domain-containing protein, partial [Thermoanaerobaculia bacterium]